MSQPNNQQSRNRIGRLLLTVGGIAGLVAILAFLLQALEFGINRSNDSDNARIQKTVIAIQAEQGNLLEKLVTLSVPGNKEDPTIISGIERTIAVQDVLIATLQGTPVPEFTAQEAQETKPIVTNILASTPTITATPKPSQTPTMTPIPTDTSTPSPSPTATMTPSPSPTPTETPSPSPTPLPIESELADERVTLRMMERRIPAEWLQGFIGFEFPIAGRFEIINHSGDLIVFYLDKSNFIMTDNTGKTYGDCWYVDESVRQVVNNRPVNNGETYSFWVACGRGDSLDPGTSEVYFHSKNVSSLPDVVWVMQVPR